MKLYKLYHGGLRGTVSHYYFETEKGNVWFAAGAEMFYRYNCILSNKDKLKKALGDCQKHEVKEISDESLEVMIDEWCTTGDRHRADELKEKLEKPAMYIVQEKRREDLETAVWMAAHALRKDPQLGKRAYERAKIRLKSELGDEEFGEFMKDVDKLLEK